MSDTEDRNLWWRTDGNFLINDPNQFMWIGSDQWPGVLFGGSADAEALPVVTRATALITGPLTAAPFKVQQNGAGAPLPTPRWLSDPMLLRPDARLVDGVQAHPYLHRLSRTEFWTNFIRSAIWWGVGAFVTQEDDNGSPLAGTMRLVSPALLSPENGSWVIGTGPDAARFDREGRITIGGLDYRLVVMRNPHSPVDEEGRSQGVFAMSPSAFGLAGQVDSYSQGTFKSGVPAGFLKVGNPGLTQDQANTLKTSWLEAHGGDQRSIAVLNSTTDFTPISMSPVDAELAAMKRLSIADVAFAFALDPVTLGVTLLNSATYNTVGEAWKNHRDFGLSPWLANMQDVLSSLMPGNKTVAVNLDGFANPPFSEQVTTGVAAVNAGLMTRDEWRATQGLPPLDDEPEPTPVDPPEEVDEDE